MPRLDAEDLLDPNGRVTSDMFPSDSADDLIARLNGWLDEAYEKPEVEALPSPDRAAESWAYYRVFSAVTDRMMANPLKFSFQDQGSRENSQIQLIHFSRMRDEALTAFRELTVPKTEKFNSGAQSGAAKNSFTW